MKFIIPSFFIFATLLGCTTSTASRQPNEREKAILQSQQYENIIHDSINKFKNETEKNCSSASIVIAESALRSMNLLSQIWYLKWSNSDAIATRTLNERVLNTITPPTIEMNFFLADNLLLNSCLDSADEIYRAIINQYTGTRYIAIRERAKIGIDDIRSKKIKQ